MRKSQFIQWIFGVAVMAAGVVVVRGAEKPPNVVILLADDLGYGELSCQNPETDIPTPHIDSIAASGVRFTDGYVTAPFCAASRAGLLTGRYQTRFGFEFNPIGPRNEDPDAGLPKKEATLAEQLREKAGYTTALIGKWHLGGTAHFNPLRRGFDEFFGFLHEGHYFVPPPYEGATTWLRRRKLPGREEGRWTSKDGRTIYSTHMGNTEPDYDADNPIYRGGQPVAEPGYVTDSFTREAGGFIRRNAGRPFFLYLAYNAVHSPLQGADPYMKRFAHIEDIQRRIFAAMLANLDDSVGAVLGELQEQGLGDDTLVFFLSDNGGPTRELTSSNAPLKGEKGSVHEGGLRVPFMVKWPAGIEGGRVYQKPVISLDIFATATAQAGVGLHNNRPIDGVNLLPYLKGEKDGAPHEMLFWRIGRRQALRMGDWKIVHQPQKGQADVYRLYHLRKDIGESVDVSHDEPERVAAMAKQWEKMNKEMVEPLFR
jgi:arylsulfatase B